MTIIVALVLGLVQGLTEFLPISSSGHLAMLSHFFGISDQAVTTAILLHVATFLSVVVVMRKDIWELIIHPFSKKTLMVVSATAVSLGVVLVLKNTIEATFSSIKFLPYFFIIAAIVLIFSEVFSKNIFKTKPLNFRGALFVGFVQGLAVFPGISRSGSTISAGLFCKVKREEAVNFSFILSLPIILASVFYEAMKLKSNPIEHFAVLPNLLAFVVAFVVGIFAIKIMQKFVKKAKMWWFSIYLILLALILFFVKT